jgi:hypothetical protein
MRCTAIYEMHGYIYIWNCLRCTPIYKITLNVRVCKGCTPMCEVHAKPRGSEVGCPYTSHFPFIIIASLIDNHRTPSIDILMIIASPVMPSHPKSQSHPRIGPRPRPCFLIFPSILNISLASRF